MFTVRPLPWLVLFLVFVFSAPAGVFAQRGPGAGGGRGPGGGGRGPDEAFAADRDVFHELLGQHESIRRTVTMRDDGVETLTESDDPEVAAKIVAHVVAMKRRIETGAVIRGRDPLFADVFRFAEKISMKVEPTDKGVRVVETSDDPLAVKLIQAHAQVVSWFVERGFDEAHRTHASPIR